VLLALRLGADGSRALHRIADHPNESGLFAPMPARCATGTRWANPGELTRLTASEA
jgi:hypothetical protein